VLAVGDADFQERCFEHFETLKKRNATIIIVTHNVDTLVDFADRTILLEKGRVKLDGKPAPVVSEYLNVLRRSSPAMERAFQRAMAGRLAQQATNAASEGAAPVSSAWPDV